MTKYTLNISKTGPNHWVIKTTVHLQETNLEVVAGGYFMREAIINCIDFLKKKAYDEEMSKLVINAIHDLESML